jgi:hypothetical protein
MPCSYEELVKFRNTHDHVNVPQTLNNKLSRWVSQQRTYRREDKQLAEDRIERLDALGFQWNVRARTGDSSVTRNTEMAIDVQETQGLS